MSLETWLAYVGAILVMMASPGPSHLLMLSNSLAHGAVRSVATAAGDLSANLLQMLAAGLGLAAVVGQSETAFTAIKWAGVAYLVWLGLGKLRAAARASTVTPPAVRSATGHRLFLQGFVTSAANPKAVVFFAALFPLFLRADAPFWPQFAVLSATYVVVDAAFLLAYGGAAASLRRLVAGRHRLLIDRIAGLGMIGAAIALGLKSNPAAAS